MYYTVLISRGQDKAADFADAIQTGALKPAAVYVVGMSDQEAFATALTDGVIEVDSSMDAKLALNFEFVQAWGTEDANTSLALLISGAKNLADEYMKAGGHQEHQKLMRRFGSRT